MVANSKIEWTDHTFSPWLGCTKISPACDHCYAEGWAKRAGSPELWQGERRRTSSSNWQLPIKWNRQAEAEGRRYRVFCASLADVFDAEVPDAWRDDLFALIAATPHLDWLLLTKRPNVAKRYLGLLKVPHHTCQGSGCNTCGGAGMVPWGIDPLPNVWLGVTVENQAMADARIPLLLETPAAKRFLSMEPLLGQVYLCYFMRGTCVACGGSGFTTGHYFSEDGTATCQDCHGKGTDEDNPGLDWVIAGGESGPGSRPTHPEWIRSLRDECVAAEVPFFYKQVGDWAPEPDRVGGTSSDYLNNRILWPDGRDGLCWFDDSPPGAVWMRRVGKKRAGRELDGVIWDEAPKARAMEAA